jgi:uncharacterized Zn-binding protein involved in type VI secretion
MGRPAARAGDRVQATDTHLVDTGSGKAPVPMEFDGPLRKELSGDVRVNGEWAATVGSIAKNDPEHRKKYSNLAESPTNEGEVITGSRTVLVNGKGMARLGDIAETCNYGGPRPVGRIAGPCSKNVFVGE